MNKLLLPSLKQKAYLSIAIPWVCTVIIGCMTALFSAPWAYSLYLGSVLWGVPQSIIAVRLFRRIEMQPARFMRKFYQSEVIKLLLVALLFILMVKWTCVPVEGLLLGYFIAQVIAFFGIKNL